MTCFLEKKFSLLANGYIAFDNYIYFSKESLCDDSLRQVERFANLEKGHRSVRRGER